VAAPPCRARSQAFLFRRRRFRPGKRTGRGGSRRATGTRSWASTTRAACRRSDSRPGGGGVTAACRPRACVEDDLPVSTACSSATDPTQALVEVRLNPDPTLAFRDPGSDHTRSAVRGKQRPWPPAVPDGPRAELLAGDHRAPHRARMLLIRLFFILLTRGLSFHIPASCRQPGSLASRLQDVRNLSSPHRERLPHRRAREAAWHSEPRYRCGKLTHRIPVIFI